MRKLNIYLLILLTGGMIYAQEFENVGFENVTCLNDCDPDNALMACVEGWWSETEPGSDAGNDPRLMKVFCNPQLVCMGAYSILIQNSGGTIGTLNPFYNMTLTNNPIVDLTAYKLVGEGQDPNSWIQVLGKLPGENYQVLGTRLPDNQGYCDRDESIILDISVSQYPELFFNTVKINPKDSDIVVDDIRFGGYALNINDHCGEVTIALAPKLDLDVDRFFVEVFDDNGNSIIQLENFNGDPLFFYPTATGTYTFAIAASYTDVTGELKYLYYELTHEVTSLQNPLPINVFANGEEISETLAYTIPCMEDCVTISTTNLQNAVYSASNPEVIVSNGEFCLPEGSHITDFKAFITGTDSCGNTYTETVDINVEQNCCYENSPINLQFIGSTLSWDPVPGAIGYIVETTPSWPMDCRCDWPVSIIPIQTTATSVSISLSQNTCSAVQVTAICADGSLSMPSDNFCIDFSGHRESTTALISLSPNPTNGKVHMYLEQVQKAQKTSLKIYDSNGRLVTEIKEIKTVNNKIDEHLDLEDQLKKGVYFFVITIDDIAEVQQIIVQ